MDDLIPPLPEWTPPQDFVPTPPYKTVTHLWCPVCGSFDPPVQHTIRMRQCPGEVEPIRYVRKTWD